MERDDDSREDDTGLEREALAATPGAAAPAPAAPGQSTAKGPARFARFLRASWAELQRVQWPDRRQVGQATAVVLGFVAIAGAFLGVADAGAEELVSIIL